MSAPTRIFVLGLQRSGTTWLANQLASLDAVAAVEDPAHRGVHESVFFSHFARNFGAWSDPKARAAFREGFGESDYYRLTGLGPEALDEIMAGAQSYADVFVEVMDRLATSQGARAWVEKSPHHTLIADDIRAAVPGARFLLVERDLTTLVNSRLHGFGREPDPKSLKFWADVVRGTVVGVLYRRDMRRLARAGRGLLIRYEDLLRDEGGQHRARILSYLGLDGAGGEMESLYSANSSFEGKKKQGPGRMTRCLIWGVALVAAMVPLGWLKRWQLTRDAKRGADWPDWVWTQTGYDPECSNSTS